MKSLRRIRRALARHGVRGTLGHARTHAAQRSEQRQVRALELAFDREHDVDTAGIVRLEDLHVPSGDKALGVRYEAIPPEAFHPLLDGIGIGDGETTFVDLGAGKGRAMLLASLYPFERVIGVEFAPELAAVARLNARRFNAPEQLCRAFEVRCEDAALYEPPDTPLVVYIYNAFAPPVLEAVLANLRRSWTHHRRRIVLLYANPAVAPAFLAAYGFQPLDESGARYELTGTETSYWRPDDDGAASACANARGK